MNSDSSTSIDLNERTNLDDDMVDAAPSFGDIRAFNRLYEDEEIEYATSKTLDDELRTPVDSDGEEVESIPVREQISNELFLGKQYSSLDEIKKEISTYSIDNGYGIRFTKSDRRRVIAKCDDCEWRLHASQMQDELTFQIKSLVDSHSCSRKTESRHASAKWVANAYIDRFKSHPKWEISSIIETVRKDFTVDISTSVATRGRSIARTLNEGKYDEQYDQLWSYGAEILQSNPNSTILFDGTPVSKVSVRFKRYYMCMAACKAGLLQCGRPVICLDGCHLKGYCPGQLLTAVSIDPNDGIYPVAVANVESECEDSWMWFLEILKADLNSDLGRGWTVISDRQKGLKNVVEKHFAYAEHRFCLRHMYANFKKLFKGKAYSEAMWNAARAPTSQYFEIEMTKLRQLSADAHAWLRAEEPRYWASHAFSSIPKCDMGLNNLSESFNALLLPARDKPILSMFEIIRNRLMTRIVKKFEKLAQSTDLLCPNIKKKIAKLERASGNWSARFAGAARFQVSNGYEQFVVDMDIGVCNCTRWDLTGIPCVHSIACMHFMRRAPKMYVHRCYHRDTYMQMYSHFIQPVSGQHMWPLLENMNKILPPHRKRQPGRPKKTRVRDVEEPSRSRISKQNFVTRCRICRQRGHNNRTCPNRGSTSGAASQDTFMGFNAFDGTQESSVRGRSRNS